MERRELRDVDVRQSLAGWLEENHACDQARILHELKVPRPSARVDVALVNGELVSFEIKSDVDSLSRLTSQIPACNSVFDRAYIVTTGRHIKSCLAKIPSWWGIVIACETQKGVFVSEIRKSKINTEWCVRSSLHILTKAELCKIALALCDQAIISSARRDNVVERIASSCDTYFVRKAINEMLKQRS